MDTELISKKDLLQLTGISYGQLYRWKRKGLIPEEWFVRKSTFTGQETFFPRDKMVPRVERILSMKDEDLSLDDIAEAVTPDLAGITLTLDEAVARGVLSPVVAELYREAHPDTPSLRFGELLSTFVVDALLRGGEISAAEGAIVFGTLEGCLPNVEAREVDLVAVRKMGVVVCVLAPGGAELCFDPAAKVVARVSLQESTEALGARLR